ncbi:MAG: C13 family peptidase [Erythrobacter sp.]
MSFPPFYKSIAVLAMSILASSGAAQVEPNSADNPNQPPPHTAPWPDLSTGEDRTSRQASVELAPEYQRGVSATELLQERRRLDAALNGLQPQRPGTIDAYVLTIALDSDPVFAREAREAANVLSRRYDAAGRTITLAGPDGQSNELPQGSITALLTALAHLAEVMDRDEDVLVLYSTSHGAPVGLAYHYGDTGYGILSPTHLKSVFEEIGIERRILIISACYSGIFAPALASDNTAILTAAAGNRTSFGCRAENDWTYFGDALINRALRKPVSIRDASRDANLDIATWEARAGLLASLPQTIIGSSVDTWLSALTARMPQTATEPVGRPAAGE